MAYWDLTTFISPDLYSDSVILFTKGLPPRTQVDMFSQPLIVLATIHVAKNYQMGCKGGNNYAVLSPYITPTSILMKRKTKAVKANKRMIKNAN